MMEGYLVIAVVLALAALPLVAVLSSAPPMVDDDEGSLKEVVTMNIFEKAYAGLNLSPGDRAKLKLCQGFLNAGVVSLLLAVPAVLSAKAGQPGVTVASVGVMVGAFVHGFLAAWQKYFSAKGDAPLAGAIGSVDAAAGAAIAQRFGSGGVAPAAKVEPPVVAYVPPVAPTGPGA